MIIRFLRLFGLLFLSTALSSLSAEWEEQALSALRVSDSDRALDLVREHENELHGKILLFAAYAQKFDQQQDVQDLSKATACYKTALKKVAIDDGLLLHELRRMDGSVLHSYSEALLDSALRRVNSARQAQAVPDVLAVLYKSEKRKVFDGLSVWLQAQRQTVKRGGQLDEDTRAVFTNEVLITALLSHMEVGKATGKPGQPPAFASLKPSSKKSGVTNGMSASTSTLPRTNATARECLVLIEEPAIPYIENRLAQLGDDGSRLLSEIYSEKRVREGSYPESSWFSLNTVK